MAGKIIYLIGTLILVVDCAILGNRGDVETRLKRSPHCEYCESHYRPYPPHFHTQNWSGFSRNADGTPQQVFSGAAAAAETGVQSAGESQAFSVASSGVDGGNAGGGYHGKKVNNIGGSESNSHSDSSRSHSVNNNPGRYDQPQGGGSSKKESWTELRNQGLSGANSQASSSSGRGDIGDEQQIQYAGSNHLKTRPLGNFQGGYRGHSSDYEYQKNLGGPSYGGSNTDNQQQQRAFGESRGQEHFSSQSYGSGIDNGNNGGDSRFRSAASSANSQVNGYDATGGRINDGNSATESRESRNNGDNFGRHQSANDGAGGFGSASGQAGGYGLTKSRGTGGFESSSGYNNARSGASQFGGSKNNGHFGGHETSRYSNSGGGRGFGTDNGDSNDHFGKYDSSRGNTNGGTTGFVLSGESTNGHFGKHESQNSIGDAGNSYSGASGFGSASGSSNGENKASSNSNSKGSELTSVSSDTAGAQGSGSSSYDSQSSLSGALNLASQGLQASQALKASQKASGCATCSDKGSLAYSNAQSHSGSAVALSIGG